MRSRWSGSAACLTVVLAIALQCWPAHGQTSPRPEPGAASFNVFLRSVPIGLERVVVVDSDDGWIVRSNGQLGGPLGLENRLSEVEYDLEWNPRRVTMDASRLGEPFILRAAFDGLSVTNTLQEGDTQTEASATVAPFSVVLPDYFFGAYEALAVRLDGAQPGDLIPVYVAPRGGTSALVREVLDQPLETAGGSFSAEVFRITFQNPDQPLEAEVWVAPNHRLLRITLPTTGLDVAREDVTSLSTRLAGVVLAGDDPQRVPASGFTLATTVTTPADRQPREGWPAVILVPGAESTDRDEYLSGIPLHGRLAGILAEAGYLVVRYDRRGVGQSGGRAESAGIEDYAEDVRDVVRYLDDRDDVDRDRIAIVAHGEGGWIGMYAASREDRIRAMVLMATPSTTGSVLVLEQQQAELDRLQLPASERQERIALQQRINDAVIEDGSWDDVPPEMRRRADTRWFRSFLEFDPAEVMRRTRQPLLIVHGLLDERISPTHADQLDALARARRRRESTVELMKVPGVNHFMVPDGGADPSGLPETSLDNMVTSAVVDWLDRILPADN